MPASTAFTYAILTGDKSVEGSIKYWVNHDEIPVSQIMELAQNRIYRDLRTRDMMATIDVVIDQGSDSESLPEEFLEPIGLLLDGDSEELPFVHENFAQRLRDGSRDLLSGWPSRWTIMDSEMQFDVALDRDASGSLMAYIQLPYLGVSNQSNFLTDRYPTVLLSACLVFAYKARNRDDMMLAEEKTLQGYIMDANALTDRLRRGQRLRG